MAKKLLEPVHPGEILLEEFLKPLEISQHRLSRDIDVPITRVNDIVNRRRAITPDTAWRLARYFGTTPNVWMNLQQRYDLEITRRELDGVLKKTIRPLGATG